MSNTILRIDLLYYLGIRAYVYFFTMPKKSREITVLTNKESLCISRIHTKAVTSKVTEMFWEIELFSNIVFFIPFVTGDRYLTKKGFMHRLCIYFPLTFFAQAGFSSSIPRFPSSERLLFLHISNYPVKCVELWDILGGFIFSKTK